MPELKFKPGTIMKALLLTVTLMFTTSVFADSFSCYSTLDLENKEKKLVSVNDKTIDIEGLPSIPVIEVVNAKIDGKSLKKCANKSPDSQYKCLNKLVPKAKEGNSTLSMHNVLIQITELEPDPKGSVGMVSGFDIATKLDIKVSDVASGTAYITKIGSYYSNSGVYEFFDAEGKSLGRFYNDAFARNCRLEK
jgi:hypothetical protein